VGLVRRAVEPVNVEQGDHAGQGQAVLLAQLRSPDPEERRAAAAELWGRPEAVPQLLEAWAAEADPAAREAMLTTLAGSDTPEVGRALAGELRCEDAGLRNAAVRALQDMPAAAAAVVPGLLADPVADVRVLAVMVLSAVPHPDVPRWLAAVVQQDGEANVVAAAVDVAVTVGGGLAAELAPLAAARFPGNPYLQFLADVAARS
jgi:hypothetical protein